MEILICILNDYTSPNIDLWYQYLDQIFYQFQNHDTVKM